MLTIDRELSKNVRLLGDEYDAADRKTREHDRVTSADSLANINGDDVNLQR